MDLTTLIGLLLSGILMVYGIGMDKLGNFVDVPSVVIVVGGTLAALIASYPFGILKDIPKHFAVLFRGKMYNIQQYRYVSCSARKGKRRGGYAKTHLQAVRVPVKNDSIEGAERELSVQKRPMAGRPAMT